MTTRTKKIIIKLQNYLPYILGPVILFIFLQFFISFFSYVDRYYLFTTVFTDSPVSKDRLFIPLYLWGVVVPGILIVFIARRISKYKLIITPLLSALIIFISPFFIPSGTEMAGLAGIIFLRLALAPNIVFALLCAIFFYLKKKQNQNQNQNILN